MSIHPDPHKKEKKLPFCGKSLGTNLISLLLIITALLLEQPLRAPLLSIGLFAFSGALTNWLAIHMLFEKVPGFYGSGVIPARFEDFKKGIHELMMRQFFTAENITRFFARCEDEQSLQIDFTPLVNSLDLNPTFEALKEAVMNSKFGGALAMFGGPAALDPIKPAFIEKMRLSMLDLACSNDFQQKLKSLAAPQGSSQSALLEKVDLIVEKRLEELTPQLVKEIIQQMIREHLGWLVVWGGVCGGLIGLGASFL